jgi:acetolactate synthase I/II/III large subunit
MKVCDYVISYLAQNAGLTHLFTYAGGTNAMLLNSAARYPGIKIVPMRHEENAALAADGYSRIKRGYGFALSMSGPGATNMITGIAQAYFDSTPVLFLTGNVTTNTYKYDLPMRQLGFQEADIVSMVKPITKGAYFIDHPDRVPKILPIALNESIHHRPGPVLIDIPFDTQRQELTQEQVSKPFYKIKTNYTLTDFEFKEMIKLLQSAERPVILAGGGIQSSDTSMSLKTFSHRLKLPVLHTLMGKDSFANDDSLYVGFIGSYGNRYANRILAAADLVIALGCRLSSRHTAKVDDFRKNKKIIHVDIDQNMLGNTIPPDLGINMDLRHFFTGFSEKSSVSNIKWLTPSSWLKAIKKIEILLSGDTEEDKGNLNPKRFLRKISQAQFGAGKTIYTVDVGGHQMWSLQTLTLRKGDRILCSGGLGTMGYAIPAAIGAHFAAPESNLIAICGDGGFQMSLPELQTIKEFDVPVKLIVINNGMLGLMKNFQDENFDGLHTATVIGYSAPDIAKVASAFGLSSQSIQSDEEVDEAIIWLNKLKKPALLEVKTPTEWGPYPKVLPGRSLIEQFPPLTEDVEQNIRKILL